MRLKFCAWIVLLTATASATAAPHEVPLPLHDGKLRVGQLTSALCNQMHLPGCPTCGQIDLNGAQGADFIAAVNAILGQGSHLVMRDHQAYLWVDPEKLPHGCRAISKAARLLAAEMEPQDIIAQSRHWGLHLPQNLDPSRPLVVLIHGLDADPAECQPMGDLLQQAGWQVVLFGYPGDQPTADSGKLLADQMRLMHERYPGMRIDIVAHSMGGLVARQYIEGPEYAGGVDHLILVATPNGGSTWARIRFLLSLKENYGLHASNPAWSWTWPITEGLGEAGADLRPGSRFLRHLNRRPRCAGVRYTIIAGNKSPVDDTEGRWIDYASNVVPARAREWWGIGRCYRCMHETGERLTTCSSESDGPVTLQSAKLSGVDDFVVLPADHVSLFLPVNGQPPAAFEAICQRLRR